MDKNGLINSEDEYWKEYNLFKRKLRIATTPTKFYELLEDAEKKGLFSKEYCTKLKIEFQKEISEAMASPSKWIKNKLKQKLKY